MKKGFTLIELLAVIVILAIIATIATPIVLSIIEDTKKSATLRSTEYYLDAVETSIATAILKNNKINDGAYKLKDGDICLDSSCSQKLEVQIKGEKPQSGYIRLTKEGLIGLAISDGSFCVTKELNDNEIKIKDYVEGECGIDFLKAPTISLSDSILNIVSNDDGTERYKIYVDGKLKTTILAQDTTNIIENDGNIIRAGTYRFNDVLSVPSADLSADLNFYLTTTDPALGMQIEVSCSEIMAYVDDSYVSYTVYETSPENALGQPGNYTAYASSYDGWLTSYHGFGIQTITIAEEQEVSAEFYNWFIANVTRLTTYNLSSLNLEDGAHEITVKAVAENYKGSPESNVVTYEIGECVLGDIIYPPEPAERLERLYMGLEPIEICGRLAGVDVDSGNWIYQEYYYYPYDYGGSDSSFAHMVDSFQDGYYLGLHDDPAIFRKITNVNGNVAYLGTMGTPDDMINVPIILIGEAGTYSYYIDVPNYASGTWTITLPYDGVAVIDLFVGWIGHVDVYNKGN